MSSEEDEEDRINSAPLAAGATALGELTGANGGQSIEMKDAIDTALGLHSVVESR